MNDIRQGKKYIGMIFECCSVYRRIYINKKKTAYTGYCPKCCKKVEVKIASDGVSNRFFKVI